MIPPAPRGAGLRKTRPGATTPENAPLVIITTNEERELPPAFLRRCVELKLKLPSPARLIDMAAVHFPGTPRDALEAVVRGLGMSPASTDAGDNVGISPTELIDTVRACIELQVKPDSKDRTWQAVSEVTVWKHGRIEGPRA
jgi:MoxR-like ATPase